MGRGFGPAAIAIVLIAGYLLATEAGAMLKNQEPGSLAYKIERFGEDFAVSTKLFPQDLKQKKLDEVKYWSGKDREAARKVAKDAIALGANVTEAGKSLGLLNTSMSEAQISAYISSEEPITDVNEWLRRILNTTLPESVNATRFMLLPGNEVNYSGKLGIRLERIDNGTVPRALFYTYGNDYGVGYLRAGDSLELQGLSVKVESIQGGAAFFAVGEKKEPLVALISQRYADRLGPEISQWIGDLESEGWDVTPVYLDSDRSIMELIETSRAFLRREGLLDGVKYFTVVGDVPWATDAWNLKEAQGKVRDAEAFFNESGLMQVDTWKIITHIPYVYGNKCVFSGILNRTAYCVASQRYEVTTGMIWPNTGDFEKDIGKMKEYFARLHGQRSLKALPNSVLYYITTGWDYNNCGETDVACIREKCGGQTEELEGKASELAKAGIRLDFIGCGDKAFQNRNELDAKMGKEFLDRIGNTSYALVIVNSHGDPIGIEGVSNRDIVGSPLGKNYMFFSCSVGRFEAWNYMAGSFVFGGNGLTAKASTTPIYVVSQRDIFGELSDGLFATASNNIGDPTTLARNRLFFGVDLLSPEEQFPLPPGTEVVSAMWGDRIALPDEVFNIVLSGYSGSCAIRGKNLSCVANAEVRKIPTMQPLDAFLLQLGRFFSGGGQVKASSEGRGAAGSLAIDYGQEELKDRLLQTGLLVAKDSVQNNLTSSSHPEIVADSRGFVYLQSYSEVGKFLSGYEDKLFVPSNGSLYLFSKGNGSFQCLGKLMDGVESVGSIYTNTADKLVMDVFLENGESVMPELKDLLVPNESCGAPVPQPALKCGALDVNGDGRFDYNDLVYRIRPEDSSQAVADAKAKQILAVLVGAEECPKT